MSIPHNRRYAYLRGRQPETKAGTLSLKCELNSRAAIEMGSRFNTYAYGLYHQKCTYPMGCSGVR